MLPSMNGGRNMGKQEVLDFFQKNSTDKFTIDDVKKAVPGEHRSIAVALAGLCADMDLIRTMEPNQKNQATAYYRLAPFDDHLREALHEWHQSYHHPKMKMGELSTNGRAGVLILAELKKITKLLQGDRNGNGN